MCQSWAHDEGCGLASVRRVSEVESAEVPVDGRVARRERNVDAVIDVVLELFSEDAMVPSMEQVAQRSGLSLRSLYRYFSDPEELHEAAVRRHRARIEPLARLEAIGEGSLDHRVRAFVAARIRVYEAVGATYRAAVHNSARNPRMRDTLARNRDEMRSQFERQFAPEITARRGAARTAVVAAGDLLSQLESIDFLRKHRQLSAAEVERTLVDGLTSILG